MMRPVRLLNLGLLAVLVGASAVVYPRLPGRFPVHFDVQGHPNRYATGGSLEWFIVPLVAGFLVALLAVVGRLSYGRPDLVSVPDKERLLRLPRERRDRVVHVMVAWLDRMATLLLCLFGLIQASIYAAARGREIGPLPAVATGAVSLLVPVGVIIMTREISRRIDAEERAAGGGK